VLAQIDCLSTEKVDVDGSNSRTPPGSTRKCLGWRNIVAARGGRATVKRGSPIVSSKWTSTIIARWSPGLFWTVHSMALWSKIPGVDQAPSIGELPGRLPLLNVAGGGKVGCQDRMHSESLQEVAKVIMSCCRISPFISANNRISSPWCVHSVMAWDRSSRKAVLGQR